MNTYTFSGKVLPERANMSITRPLPIAMEAKDAGISGAGAISILVSQISVVFNTEDSNVDLPTLKNYVEGIVRNLVDAYGYLSGRGYDIEITSVVDPAGMQTVFGVGVGALEQTQSERPLSFQDLKDVVFKSQELRRALSDLREAIRSPLDTGFFCYRAIECIRQSFRQAEDGDKDGPSWGRLRDMLRVDRSWIEVVKKSADPQRHGGTPYMSGEDRVSAMLHAWKVVDRFCIYVRRGFNPLPEDEFTVLKEA